MIVFKHLFCIAVGVIAVTQMAVGDGLADIVGRKWGSVKWPFSKSKSLVGSGAFLLGSFTISVVLLLLLQVMSHYSEVLILQFFTTVYCLAHIR